MKLLLSVLALNTLFLFACSAPLTCYSRVLTLGKEITESFRMLERSVPAGPCMDALPKLYLDIHNACVMKKLSMFISTPKCGRLLRVTALKKKDLVFFTDDCDALEPHLLASTITPVFSR
ncbi:hypothetical protein FKM82_001626 [Ascaphus truei]